MPVDDAFLTDDVPSGATTVVAASAVLWGPAVLGARPDQILKII